MGNSDNVVKILLNLRQELLDAIDATVAKDPLLERSAFIRIAVAEKLQNPMLAKMPSRTGKGGPRKPTVIKRYAAQDSAPIMVNDASPKKRA